MNPCIGLLECHRTRASASNCIQRFCSPGEATSAEVSSSWPPPGSLELPKGPHIFCNLSLTVNTSRGFSSPDEETLSACRRLPHCREEGRLSPVEGIPGPRHHSRSQMPQSIPEKSSPVSGDSPVGKLGRESLAQRHEGAGCFDLTATCAPVAWSELRASGESLPRRGDRLPWRLRYPQFMSALEERNPQASPEAGLGISYFFIDSAPRGTGLRRAVF